MSMTDQDIRRERYEERQRRRAIECQCGYPDMPGQCPGPSRCPMCQTDDDEQ